MYFCFLHHCRRAFVWCLQVAQQLGREYEDTVALLEPDHDDWQDKLQYDFGYDATDGNPYPGDWITREVLEEPGMLDQIQTMAAEDAKILQPMGTEGGWGI